MKIFIILLDEKFKRAFTNLEAAENYVKEEKENPSRSMAYKLGLQIHEEYAHENW